MTGKTSNAANPSGKYFDLKRSTLIFSSSVPQPTSKHELEKRKKKFAIKRLPKLIMTVFNRSKSQCQVSSIQNSDEKHSDSSSKQRNASSKFANFLVNVSFFKTSPTRKNAISDDHFKTCDLDPTNTIIYDGKSPDSSTIVSCASICDETIMEDDIDDDQYSHTFFLDSSVESELPISPMSSEISPYRHSFHCFQEIMSKEFRATLQSNRFLFETATSSSNEYQSMIILLQKGIYSFSESRNKRHLTTDWHEDDRKSSELACDSVTSISETEDDETCDSPITPTIKPYPWGDEVHASNDQRKSYYTGKRVTFVYPLVTQVGFTYNKSSYERKGYFNTNFTAEQAVEIRRELNQVKREMQVHELSRNNTHFYI